MALPQTVSSRTGGPAGREGGPRVLLYSHDGFGLGHLQRNYNIAQALVRELPDASALLLAGSPHGFDSRLPRGVDVLKLPSIVKEGTGAWVPRSLNVGAETLRRLRVEVIDSAVRLFAPDLLLVDFLPTGVWGELLPALEACRLLPSPPKVVLGLRDVLDEPQATRRLWRRLGAYEALAAHYDRILVYGCREVFPTATLYGLDGSLLDRVRYCGYLGPERLAGASPFQRGAPFGQGALPERGRPEKARRILVTGGGGSDAYPMMRRAIEGLAALPADLAFRADVVTGPLMEARERSALRRQAEGLPIDVLWQVEEMTALMADADLVVTMAGYNTLLEALSLHRRILVLPREGPSAEQTMRAEAFARLGLVALLPEGEMTGEAIARAIGERLAATPPETSVLALDGLPAVIRELTGLLAERTLREHATAPSS